MNIEALLNPRDTGLVDILPQISILSKFQPEAGKIMVPVHIQQQLALVLDYLESPQATNVLPAASSPSSSGSSSPTQPEISHGVATEHGVRLNRKTRLSTLYRYPRNMLVEYPETGEAEGESVGHLFEVDPDNWINPALHFAYSQGSPKGFSKPGEDVKCALLLGADSIAVPCRKRHSTCECHSQYLCV